MNPHRKNWLSNLKAKYPRIGAELVAHAGIQPTVGAVCVAEPMDRSADNILVLVVGSEPESYSFTVVLLTPDIELATDRDVFLPSDATGLPYELAAQTDIFGYVWSVQLKPIGSVPSELVRGLFHHNPAEHAIASEFKAGPRLDSPADPRWVNKIAELDRLNAVSGDCTRQLIEGEQDLIVDPVSFRLEGSGISDFDLVDFVLHVVTMIEKGEVAMPAWLMRGILMDSELEESYRKSGLLDIYSVLTQVLNQKLQSIGDEPDVTAAARVDRSGLELLQDQALLDRAAVGTTSVKLLGRSRDGTPYPQRRIVGRRMFQCVLIPCHS